MNRPSSPTPRGVGLWLLLLAALTTACGETPPPPGQETLILEKRAGYTATKEKLTASQAAYRAEYLKAGTARRGEIVAAARAEVLKAIVEELFPAWYGTTWAFEGVTQVPGEGEIACGYFVTTLLRDAGFKVQRAKLAQQASQRIIKTVAAANDIKLTYEKPIAEVEAQFKAAGPGLYIVGLDQHTGFVLNDGVANFFIHSSYYRPPFSVVREPVTGHNPLFHSKYRMSGKILGDAMMRKWILGEDFPMK